MAAIRFNVCGRSEAEVQVAVWARGGDDQSPWVQMRGANGIEVNICGECADRAEATRNAPEPKSLKSTLETRPSARNR